MNDNGPTGSREPCMKKPQGHAESVLPFAGSPGKAALSIHRLKLKKRDTQPQKKWPHPAPRAGRAEPEGTGLEKLVPPLT